MGTPVILYGYTDEEIKQNGGMNNGYRTHS